MPELSAIAEVFIGHQENVQSILRHGGSHFAHAFRQAYRGSMARAPAPSRLPEMRTGPQGAGSSNPSTASRNSSCSSIRPRFSDVMMRAAIAGLAAPSVCMLGRSGDHRISCTSAAAPVVMHGRRIRAEAGRRRVEIGLLIVIVRGLSRPRPIGYAPRRPARLFVRRNVQFVLL
jgi:hypothetical protein